MEQDGVDWLRVEQPKHWGLLSRRGTGLEMGAAQKWGSWLVGKPGSLGGSGKLEVVRKIRGQGKYQCDGKAVMVQLVREAKRGSWQENRELRRVLVWGLVEKSERLVSGSRGSMDSDSRLESGAQKQRLGGSYGLGLAVVQGEAVVAW